MSLSVAPGEVVGLEGHNGSGKSTLLRIAATSLKATSGSVFVDGRLAEDAPDQARARIALMSFQPGLYDDLTARENLHFASRMLDLRAPDLDSVLERVGLRKEGDERVRTFSSGMQRRLSLGRLLLQQPKILLLDEPYNSFDRAGVSLVNEIVREVCAAGGCALIVLHDHHSAEGMLDRTIVLRHGLIANPASEAQQNVSPRAVAGVSA